MTRKTGYLANLLNVPPLVFKFQYNPSLLVEKKSYRYEPAQHFGRFNLDKTDAGQGFKAVTGFIDDIKDIGAILTNTKPLEPQGGEHRTFEIDFALAAHPADGDGALERYGGSIVPDLEILRSFMYPGLDPLKIPDFFGKDPPCWNTPPSCTLRYAGVTAECVMTDLSIKMTDFAYDGEPTRAEVTVTLKEQPWSVGPVIDTVVRAGQVVRSMFRPHIDEDLLLNAPFGVGSVASLFM